MPAGWSASTRRAVSNNSFATGAVTGKDAVGALTGRNNGSLRNVYATGTVDA